MKPAQPTINQNSLNGACPYFTMFPLEFPLRILKTHANQDSAILDPFCGRGTTNFAARLLGLYSAGVDSSPVASAIASGKLVNTNPNEIAAEVHRILDSEVEYKIPSGEFWELAYHPDVLNQLCKIRAVLNKDCHSDSRKALRLIILGALHGPQQKIMSSYFSNQSMRTFAPKPRYAVKYWTQRKLLPKKVDLEKIICQRANRFFSGLPEGRGIINLGDSRVCAHIPNDKRYSIVITSPPYYGMRTYIPDQWLRNWFLGGTDFVDYSCHNQVTHSRSQAYIDDLKRVSAIPAEKIYNPLILTVLFEKYLRKNGLSYCYL